MGNLREFSRLNYYGVMEVFVDLDQCLPGKGEALNTYAPGSNITTNHVVNEIISIKEVRDIGMDNKIVGMRVAFSFDIMEESLANEEADDEDISPTKENILPEPNTIIVGPQAYQQPYQVLNNDDRDIGDTLKHTAY